ncbi:MAG: SpoIVB peptidase S55 domain-containing protein [Candidatus Bipolaricaulota bacterium]
MTKRSVLFSCLLLVVFSSLASAYDRSEFLFLDEIEIGMTGIGQTIVAGDIIEEFTVDVLGVIDQAGTLSDFIVVQVSGEVIGRTGGIAQGMSGSPVYVDGKLIGALSRAANWSKAITPIGLVTPIEPMLAVLDDARTGIIAAEPALDAVLADVGFVQMANRPNDDLVAAMPDVIFSYPVSTPLITTGLSGRSLDILMSGLSSHKLSAKLVTDVLDVGIQPEIRGLSSLGLTLLPLAGSGPGAAADPSTLVAGGSVGVALAMGDMSIGSLGTITYRDGDTLVGYGHSFIANGSAQFPLAGVSIIDTMKSFEASFKLGTLGDPLGTILEDRTAAIGGRLGPVADLIDLSLGVRDADRNLDDSYSIGLVDEPRLMPELLLSMGFEAIDTTLDRVGQGTVEVTYQILGDNMPFPLERKDVFFSSTDVAVYAPWQLASIVAFLQYNAFEDPEITGIVASMQFTEEIKGVQIGSLILDRPFYVPGDTIHYEVALQTFQGEGRLNRGSLQIPEDLLSDVIVVRAYGGPRYLEDGEPAPEYEGLGDLIEAVERIPSYDMLTVELFAVDLYSLDPSALFGVAEETFEFPGYAIYDEREITVPLLLDSNSATSSEPDGSGNGPGW